MSKKSQLESKNVLVCVWHYAKWLEGHIPYLIQWLPAMSMQVNRLWNLKNIELPFRFNPLPTRGFDSLCFGLERGKHSF